jgi:hypothetical protein
MLPWNKEAMSLQKHDRFNYHGWKQTQRVNQIVFVYGLIFSVLKGESDT